jgi:hypothetical protein
MLVRMIALITDSKIILVVSLGIPVALGLIAMAAALTRPK